MSLRRCGPAPGSAPFPGRFHVRIGHERHQLPPQPRLVRVSPDAFLEPCVLYIVEMSQDPFEGAELGDQPLRRLLPYPGHTWNVVGGVSRQRQHIDDLFRHHAETPLHTVDVVQSILHRVDHHYVFRHHLQEILVPRDDEHLHPLFCVPSRQGRYQVVRLDTLLFEYGDREPPDDILDEGNLRDEGVRGWSTVGLVRLVDFVTERRPFEVEGDGDVVGLTLPQELHQHRRKAVNGVRRKTFRVGEMPDGIEGPEDVIAPVYQVQGGFLLFFAHLQLKTRVDLEGAHRAHRQDFGDPASFLDPREGLFQ